MTIEEFRSLPIPTITRSKKNDLPINGILAEQLANVDIQFEREFQFHPKRKWRADFMIPMTEKIYERDKHFLRAPIIIDLQGGTFAKMRLGHSTGIGLQKSFEKLNEAVIMGFRVLQFDSQQVRDGVALTTILRALGIGLNKSYRDGKIGH